MTTVPPPSGPPASLHTHPEVPDGIVPAPRPPEPPTGSLAPVPFWAPLVVLVFALVAATLAVVLIVAGIGLGGGDVSTGDNPPGVVIPATFVQDLALIAGSFLFARLWARGVTPASFGLRPTAFWPAVGWTLLAWGVFAFLSFVYFNLVGQPDDQALTSDLREEESPLALIGYVVLLAFAAPVAEEVFFRGFVFGVLREKIGVAGGAIATGVVFGLVHATGSPIATLGVLVILGVLLCVLYVQTGSLLPCIALHALNNGLSFALTTEPSILVGILVVLGSPAAAVGVAALVMQRSPALPGARRTP